MKLFGKIKDKMAPRHDDNSDVVDGMENSDYAAEDTELMTYLKSIKLAKYVFVEEERMKRYESRCMMEVENVSLKPTEILINVLTNTFKK